MAAVPRSVARQAELLKQNGNTYFKKERIGAAIDAYTEAITLCPDVAVYWMNRAMCYLKKDNWSRVEEDCKKALQLDSHSVMAHYLLGLSLLVRHDYSRGIKELEKALEGANPASYLFENIREVLARAKYMEWKASSSKRASKMQKLKETCEAALVNYHNLDDSKLEDGSKIPEREQLQQLEDLKNVFNKATRFDVPSEVPDYLCCKITLDIFRDPVITPSGITYERTVLLHHLHKVGKFDPMTRELLEPHQLVPNIALKEAVQAFLKENPWAYKMMN